MTKQALEKMITGTKEERIFLAENSFGLFCVYYFSNYFQYKLADYHYDLFQDCEDLVNGKIREVVWIIYREGGKTTIEKLFLIWCITFKKRLYPNTDAFDKENAERILFDVAFELTNNTRFRADFGLLFSKEKSVNEVKQNRINNFITQNGVRVEAHSTQESMRGRLHLNQRPDMLTIDDFETNKTKSSVAYTKQVNDHISEAMAGLAPNGFILYCCNYLSEAGNVQWLIDRAKNDNKIRIRNIPVMDDREIPAWPAKYARTDEEAEKTGKVSIEDKQRQLGSLVFSYEMMNKPIDEMLAEFKKEFINLTTEADVKQKETTCYVTIDSAVSEKESADFTGVTINRISMENKWYVKTYRLKCNSKELIDHIFYLHATYSPDFMGLEETTFTMAIQPFLEDEMRKRSKFFSITPVKHRGINKETRIRGLIPRWENRSIFLVGDNSELLDEMRVFPNGQHDDVIDSLSMQLPHARAPHRPPMTLRNEEPERNPAI
jgi:phage terminase large subunit-like protein